MKRDRRGQTLACELPATAGRAHSLDLGEAKVPFYVVLFAVSNFLGPLLLGSLFDTVGRKPMIAGTRARAASQRHCARRSSPGRARRVSRNRFGPAGQ